jgi:hypothetical protein
VVRGGGTRGRRHSEEPPSGPGSVACMLRRAESIVSERKASRVLPPLLRPFRPGAFRHSSDPSDPEPADGQRRPP